MLYNNAKCGIMQADFYTKRLSMDSIKVKRIAKKVAKNGFWIASDVFFLGLKVVGTFALIALTTAVVFACFFIYYIRNDLAVGLEINPADFVMNQSSIIYYVDLIPEVKKNLLLYRVPSFAVGLITANSPTI